MEKEEELRAKYINEMLLRKESKIFVDKTDNLFFIGEDLGGRI